MLICLHIIHSQAQILKLINLELLITVIIVLLSSNIKNHLDKSQSSNKRISSNSPNKR